MPGIKIFDTDECAWKDVRVDIAGARILKLKRVKWGIKKAKEYRFGEGDEPRGIQSKNKEPFAEIEVSRGVLRDMNLGAKAAGGDDITDISFPIVIKFRAKGGRTQELITLADAEVTEFTDEMTQGDAEGTVVLPIMFLKAVQI